MSEGVLVTLLAIVCLAFAAINFAVGNYGLALIDGAGGLFLALFYCTLLKGAK